MDEAEQNFPIQGAKEVSEKNIETFLRRNKHLQNTPTKNIYAQMKQRKEPVISSLTIQMFGHFITASS